MSDPGSTPSDTANPPSAPAPDNRITNQGQSGVSEPFSATSMISSQMTTQTGQDLGKSLQHLGVMITEDAVSDLLDEEEPGRLQTIIQDFTKMLLVILESARHVPKSSKHMQQLEKAGMGLHWALEKDGEAARGDPTSSKQVWDKVDCIAKDHDAMKQRLKLKTKLQAMKMTTFKSSLNTASADLSSALPRMSFLNETAMPDLAKSPDSVRPDLSTLCTTSLPSVKMNLDKVHAEVGTATSEIDKLNKVLPTMTGSLNSVSTSMTDLKTIGPTHEQFQSLCTAVDDLQEKYEKQAQSLDRIEQMLNQKLSGRTFDTVGAGGEAARVGNNSTKNHASPLMKRALSERTSIDPAPGEPPAKRRGRPPGKVTAGPKQLSKPLNSRASEENEPKFSILSRATVWNYDEDRELRADELSPAVEGAMVNHLDSHPDLELNRPGKYLSARVCTLAHAKNKPSRLSAKVACHHCEGRSVICVHAPCKNTNEKPMIVPRDPMNRPEGATLQQVSSWMAE